jgi:hypothetical protein
MNNEPALARRLVGKAGSGKVRRYSKTCSVRFMYFQPISAGSLG